MLKKLCSNAYSEIARKYWCDCDYVLMSLCTDVITYLVLHTIQVNVWTTVVVLVIS